MTFRSANLAAAALALLMLASCAGNSRFSPDASPAPGTRVNWPGVSFAEVRGFCYDYTAELARHFFVNGRMHKGVLDPKGVKLTKAQTKRLLDDITVSQPKASAGGCYKPHHAYVFYDAGGKVVAVFEMCFACNEYVATPEGLPRYINRSDLWLLTQDVGLPVGTGNQFYTDTVRAAHQGQH
jgi:hypothetical protein